MTSICLFVGHRKLQKIPNCAMFKFDFQFEEEDDEQVQIPTTTFVTPTQSSQANAGTSNSVKNDRGIDRRCHHLSLDELIKTLPDAISYSPLYHQTLYTPLLRRDLFDARFQLINKGTEDEPKEIVTPENEDEGDYVDAKTDLIPGLYEGGLKTWEGGVDLVEVLARSLPGNTTEEQNKNVGEWVKGGKVLEVGCGTSLPTAFLLRSLLSLPTSSAPSKTILHLQDYNQLVLSLVSLPNLILAALPYLPPEVLRLADEGDEPIETVVPDLEEPGNLSLNKDLVEAFQKLLKERGIELIFTYGHWEGLSKKLKEEKDGYGLVLTAETIYSQDSTPALIDVLREAVGKSGPIEHKADVELESSLEDLRVKDDWTKRPLREISSGLALVAAKVLYFGVGGGLQAFLHAAEANGAYHCTVKEWSQGVGRKVVQIGW
ncbi:hypothetical protein C349_00681 [Cryptococcus neoformans var. grubii Br795]|nr:hypothetical protein C353_00710 [Cryptococcus neoformans var. grubii AD1-83a]OXG68381.1 hypothetical protein C351_00711 [Cryptococcus neoformans var. grubii c8]OXG68943.1 hypothetical protein C354_00713 [Cryptococcus neoformans var. grubii MW-RSA1955]OXG72530.1 hypothetical protein C352_00709 [Cryptococcus neoformans var. grubii CHC193]OXG88325.1 hypothetical protein C350_00698 [Cryptococcus neoformans var. grubii MW-RSA36]OXG91895.1 hypothetical protein C349_00681 [Cryptococcus neoformans 